MQFNHELGFNH